MVRDTGSPPPADVQLRQTACDESATSAHAPEGQVEAAHVHHQPLRRSAAVRIEGDPRVGGLDEELGRAAGEDLDPWLALALDVEARALDGHRDGVSSRPPLVYAHVTLEDRRVDRDDGALLGQGLVGADV